MSWLCGKGLHVKSLSMTMCPRWPLCILKRSFCFSRGPWRAVFAPKCRDPSLPPTQLLTVRLTPLAAQRANRAVTRLHIHSTTTCETARLLRFHARWPGLSGLDLPQSLLQRRLARLLLRLRRVPRRACRGVRDVCVIKLLERRVLSGRFPPHLCLAPFQLGRIYFVSGECLDRGLEQITEAVVDRI